MKIICLTILLFALALPLRAESLSSDQNREAGRLFAALGCRGCHGFAPGENGFGPSLDRIGLKLDAAQILQRLQLAPEELGQGEKFMPSYRTTPIDQLELLSRYLAARK